MCLRGREEAFRAEERDLLEILSHWFLWEIFWGELSGVTLSVPQECSKSKSTHGR